jgi:hypothetical protein
MRSPVVPSIAFVLLVLLSGTALAKSSPGQKCLATKLSTVSKLARGLLKCHSKAAKAGRSIDSACVSKATGKVARAFSKAEKKGRCFSSGDAGAVVAKVSEGVAALGPAFRPTADASKCAAAKLKAASKRIAAEFTAFAKARKKGNYQKLGARLAKAQLKLNQAFAKQEDRGDCSTVGDTAAVEQAAHSLVGGVLLDVDGCTAVTAEAFEAQAPGLWESTFAHARDLGYDVVRDATLCPGLGAGAPTRAAALLVDPTATPPDDTLELLFFANPRPFAILLRMDAEQVPTLFNQGGGVRMPADGPPELVAPDGRTPASVTLVSPAGDAMGNSCARREELYRACLIASDVLNVFGCAAALVTAVGSYGTATAVAAIVCTQALLPGPIGIGCEGFWNEMRVCDRGSKCSSRDECSWGACRPAVPANVGASCAEEQAGNLPLCLPEDPRAIVRVLCTPGGLCGSRFDRCPDDEVCAGAPGAAGCSEPPPSSTTTTTTTPTTTTLPSNAIAGAWNGTLHVNSPGLCTGQSGSWTASFSVNGNQLSGNWQSSFGPSGTLSGTVNGDNASFSVGGGGSGVSFQAVVAGTSISGSFSGPECPDQSGTASGSFQGSKTGS